VCSASFSNLLGILVTPALVALLMNTSGSGGISIESIEAIVLQLLVPFVAGHLLRPWIGAWVTRNKSLLTVVDRGSILLVVYSAFGAAVVEGLWTKLSIGDLILIGLLCAALLAFVLGRCANDETPPRGCDRAAILRFEEEPRIGRADGRRAVPARASRRDPAAADAVPPTATGRLCRDRPPLCRVRTARYCFRLIW
jgi:hypothetical protein